MNLRQALYAWRANEAAKRAVELFRILPSSTLDEIVRKMPETTTELVAIKGIKEAKCRLYGETILGIVDEFGRGKAPQTSDDEDLELPGVSILSKEALPHALSVSAYLDIVNNALWRISARVQGEVTSVKFQGSAVYFSVKDAQEESLLNVFMWRSDFETSGVEMKEGVEVIIEGRSEVYKPSGRLSFRAHTIELLGAGAQKAAYEALKKKLSEMGLFAQERKRPLPLFPERIGLVTSREGAVIHDFLNNLGRFGFHVSFVDSRVEGAAAVKDLLAAIRRLRDVQIDTLVIIRGGGSLESLQAFNNEHVIHAIATFPVPVICAIGHDKDVPLAQMVADLAPSTPTATTVLLNASWEDAKAQLRLQESTLLFRFHSLMETSHREINELRNSLFDTLSLLRSRFNDATYAVLEHVPTLRHALGDFERKAQDSMDRLVSQYRARLVQTAELLQRCTSEIALHDPLRLLQRGYSIIAKKGRVVHSVREVSIGENFEARLADGTLKAIVTEIGRMS